MAVCTIIQQNKYAKDENKIRLFLLYLGSVYDVFPPPAAICILVCTHLFYRVSFFPRFLMIFFLLCKGKRITVFLFQYGYEICTAQRTSTRNRLSQSQLMTNGTSKKTCQTNKQMKMFWGNLLVFFFSSSFLLCSHSTMNACDVSPVKWLNMMNESHPSPRNPMKWASERGNTSNNMVAIYSHLMRNIWRVEKRYTDREKTQLHFCRTEHRRYYIFTVVTFQVVRKMLSPAPSARQQTHSNMYITICTDLNE